MKLKMLTSMAGVAFALSPGDIVDNADEAEALRLIDAGYAVRVDDDAETADRVVVPEVETAVTAKKTETRKGKGR